MNLANTTDVNVLQERVDATDSNRYIQSKDRSGLLKLTGRKIVGGTAVILNNPFQANPYSSNSVYQQLRVECNSILKV